MSDLLENRQLGALALKECGNIPRGIFIAASDIIPRGIFIAASDIIPRGIFITASDIIPRGIAIHHRYYATLILGTRYLELA
jgi:hypothetical protein